MLMFSGNHGVSLLISPVTSLWSCIVQIHLDTATIFSSMDFLLTSVPSLFSLVSFQLACAAPSPVCCLCLLHTLAHLSFLPLTGSNPLTPPSPPPLTKSEPSSLCRNSFLHDTFLDTLPQHSVTLSWTSSSCPHPTVPLKE